MEEWQNELHMVDISGIPDEDFNLAPSGGWSTGTMGKRNSPSPFTPEKNSKVCKLL